MNYPRGRGHIPDSPDIDLPHVSALVGASPMPPARAIDYVDRILDQHQSSACVGAAFAQAIHCRAGAMGIDIPFPSWFGIYDLARRGTSLVDDGCSPMAAVMGMQLFGVVAEKRWPSIFDASGRPTNVNQGLPWDVFQAGSDARVNGCYGVEGSNAGALKDAIGRGWPVCFAQSVDDAFENYSGGILGDFDGANHGGHYTTIVDFDDAGVWAVNSWSSDWGIGHGLMSGGLYRASWARLASPRCADFRVVSIAPSEVT